MTPSSSHSTATRDYHRAWWSVALFPVGLVAAFVVGEGILSALGADPASPTGLQVLMAGTPALALAALPGLAAFGFGRRAVRGGRAQAQVPMLLGGVGALGFVALNLVSYLVGRFV